MKMISKTVNAAPKTRTTPIKTGTKPVKMSKGDLAVTGKRYSIVNKNTGSVRRGANTRAEARSVKKVNERIYDTAKAAFIR